MSPSLPEISNVQDGATVLAVRCLIAQQVNGRTKTADWRDSINQFIQRLTSAKPSLETAFGGGKAAPPPAPSGPAPARPSLELALRDAAGDGASRYWGDVRWEALRNALIGAGVGGVGGTVRSLISKKRRKRPLSSALRGALLGAALGGGGTALYRGGHYLGSPLPGQHAADVADLAKFIERNEAQISEQDSPSVFNLITALPREVTKGFSGEPNIRVHDPSIEAGGRGDVLDASARIYDAMYGRGANPKPLGGYAGTMGAAGVAAPWLTRGLWRRWRAVSRLQGTQKPSEVLPEGSKKLHTGHLAGREVGGIPLGTKKEDAARVLEAARQREFWRPGERVTYGLVNPESRVPGLSHKQLAQSAKRAVPGWGWKRMGMASGVSGLAATSFGAWLDRMAREGRIPEFPAVW